MLDLRRRWLGRRGCLNLERLFPLDFGPGDVLREVHEAHPRLLRLRLLEGLADHLGDDLRLANLGAVFGYGREQVHQVQVLVALLVHAGGGRLPGDGHDRRSIHIRVGDPGHQVRRAGTQRGEANPGPTREPPVNVGHEGRPLLVARRDELDGAVEQYVHHVNVLFARDAKDALDPFVLKTADEQLGGFHNDDHSS